MRALAPPTLDAVAVFQTCTNSIADSDLQNRLKAIEGDIEKAADEYRSRAATQQLYRILPCTAKNSEFVAKEVTKQELKNLYTDQMVPKTKMARHTYDSLIANAPYGKCPSCALGQATTLDHYLPKAKYPLTSTVPINLVPSCKDCNTTKSTQIATRQNEQSFHPYFDHEPFTADSWLYAEVIEGSPLAVLFFVNPPTHWNQISGDRARAHFKSFNLAERYSQEATNELAGLKFSLPAYEESLAPSGIRRHLVIEKQKNETLHPNSWQTALYRALSESDWYCNGGYRS